jgi:dephospho-CoA kinase
MFTVGLTGGYATGKSFVAAELERLGCHLIYADRLGHEVLLPDGEAFQATVDAFGREILTSDGTIDRKKLGAIVFGSPDLLKLLETFVHPAVFRLERRMLDHFEREDPDGIAVIEAAILIETGRYKMFDRLILTTCDEETQIARSMKRDGISRAQARERIARQLPLEEKKRHAHYVVDTSRDKEQTLAEVRQVFRDLKLAATTRLV